MPYKPPIYKPSREDYNPAEPDKEFNQMAFYLLRVDDRQNDRDLALIEGDLEKFYRATLAILINTIPRFREKEIKYAETEKKIYEIGAKIRSAATMSQEMRIRNKPMYEEDLTKINVDLNELMFKAGMVYPSNKSRSLEDKAREDFEGLPPKK